MQSVARQRETISRIIKDRLSGDLVDSIEITEGFDQDDDPVIQITVVVKDKINSLDRRRMLGLARYIRNGLIDDDRFPIIEFITRQDAKKRREAA